MLLFENAFVSDNYFIATKLSIEYPIVFSDSLDSEDQEILNSPITDLLQGEKVFFFSFCWYLLWLSVKTVAIVFACYQLGINKTFVVAFVVMIIMIVLFGDEGNGDDNDKNDDDLKIIILFCV